MINPKTIFRQVTGRIPGAKTLLLSLLLLLVAGGTAFWPSGSQAVHNSSSAKRQRPEFVPGEALVRFKPGRAFEGRANVTLSRKEVSATPFDNQDPQQMPVEIDRFEGSDLVNDLRIARMAPEQTLPAVEALKARADVLYAEPNYVRHLERTPNDPSFNQLYGMSLIGAPQAWDVTQGSRNIVVAVIDEGIDVAHPDLQANIWINPSPGSITGIAGDVNGYDFRDHTGNIIAEPHATHVAGTIGAVGNNGVGVTGVNWQVSLMSLRFISDSAGTGTSADAMKAYNYVKQMKDLWASSNHTKGADIRAVNASYGGGGYSQAESDAINAMGQSGVLFVAAAGNESSNSDINPHYPSGYSLPNVISVAATTNTPETLASFSNYGAHSVLMGAPGLGILSTLPNNTYGNFSGTSMATPHVVGAAALLCAASPNLSVGQLRALLSFNGDSISALQGKSLTGRRLNVAKSLAAINENDTTPPGMVSNFQITSQNGRSVNLSWTASGDDGAAGQASLYDLSFVDQNTNAVIPLTSVAPDVSGSTQTASVNLPYRHTAGTIRLREFDNVGNEGTPATTAVTVPLAAADPYTTTLTSPETLSTGGTALGLKFDDAYKLNFNLPFAFPFFGQAYNSVSVSTNGNLYFSPPPLRSNGDADDVPSSTADLSLRKMISGMWDDLDLSRGNGADVYETHDATHQIFRWQGVQFGDGSPINFEIELKNDGTIRTRYGAGNTNLLPVVGISGGGPDAYVIDALTSETSPKTLTNAQSAVFTPRSSCTYAIAPTSLNFTFNGGSSTINVSSPAGCTWIATSSAPWITITNGSSGTGNGSVSYSVGNNSVPSARAGTITIGGLSFNVTQDAGPTIPPPIIEFSAPGQSASESNGQIFLTVTRNGDRSGVSTVDFATSDNAGSQACNVTNGNASARCDYESLATRIVFAPNESIKTIGISIINDAYHEGNETFTAKLTNPSGAALGSQSQATITIIDNDDTDGLNPLSDSSFFVRQHYIDFLNREPDASGLAFWTGQTTNCGATDLTVCRINVSGAFFLSIEFQQTGYLVERIYKAAFGDVNGASSTGGTHTLRVPNVRFEQFLPDTLRIGQGVIVNQGNWQQQLEDNKNAFVQEFVQRGSFLAQFPSSMTPADFVDQLNLNARDSNDAKPLSQAERDNLVNALANQTMTRAQVLRAVAEDADLFNSEKNRAFVLMQYFGYLRRNPNDPRDTDYAGYEFWLNKLNAANGDYIAAEMVKAFLASSEYNQRFAP
ncbi:MAG TPA: S8 family serine peptidase [Pyrinomonadaceae bacterium]|nr:S8 family serine peptidase [Pyrinomonadaceae bacterium]